MSNNLYLVFSKEFLLDTNVANWSIEDDEPDKYYFIPENKINYGLKFHKLFFNYDNKTSLNPFNKEFIDEVVERLIDGTVYAEYIEDYANFLGIEDIIFGENHKFYNFFYNKFASYEEFRFLLIYKLICNGGKQEFLNLFLENRELIQLKQFLQKYDLKNILDTINETTVEFFQRPLNHGAAALIAGVLMPIDLDAIDSSKPAELNDKIKTLEIQGFQLINNENIVKDAYRSLMVID
jgi:hypothetical protein